MNFDLSTLLEQRRGEAESLHRKFVNPSLCSVLGYIGFEPEYVKGEDVWLESDTGHRILDGLAGYGVFALGRNHPEIVRALEQALHHNLPSLVQMDCPLLSGLLAEALVEIAPPGLEAVFFTNSGTEAVEGAIKFARCATKRPVVLHHRGSFHGLSCGSLSVNGDESFREGFGELLPGCEAIDFSDVDSLEARLKCDDVAGLIFEPIRGKGVYYPQDDRVLPTVQRLCRERGTLLIADEIQCGLGRTGKMWACNHWNLEPDILLTAKALSGGIMPIGAILSRRKIHSAVFSRLDRCVVHSSTFGQNCYAMVAGLATLHLFRELNLVEKAATMGARLLEGLRGMADRYDSVHDVRGKGLMIGVEFGPPKSLSKKAAWALLHKAEKGLFAQALVMRLYGHHHILTQVAGHHQEVIKLLPPLIIQEPEVDLILDAFEEVLQSAGKFPGPIWDVGSKLVGAAAKSLRKGA